MNNTYETIASGMITEETRQKLYKFLINRPDAVKALVRSLTEDEGCSLIGLLANADDRRQGKPTKVQRSKAEREIAEILGDPLFT